ncbi:MAG: phosphotransferase [Myxococcota bacterium]|jgi:N-acetylmuramate 1-kinase|nr:phosphotransferase [Myxococcota bacterium]
MSHAVELPIAALERLVERATGTPPPLRFEEILGGASVRRFLRVPIRDGSTVVAMFVPIQTHEFQQKERGDRRWPFLEVLELLSAHGVRVPRLLAEACEERLILVEDLGETLAQHLSHSPGDREALYRVAVRDLSRAQLALGELPRDSVVRERAFDRELLSWELEHFRRWALEARGIELGPEDREVFDAAAEYLATTIAGLTRGFVHRDYQSRNLMVVKERDGSLGLGWIDFQDALLGPRVYDLVALLGDSYQSFEPEFVAARLAEFGAGLGLSAAEQPELEREFSLVMVQRKLKDSGRFVYLDRELENPSFLKFVEPTIRKAQRALDRLTAEPKLAALSALLERLFPRATA